VKQIFKKKGARSFKIFDTLVLKPQGKGFKAQECSIIQDINFDLLNMIDARWENNKKIMVRADPLKWDEKIKDMIPSGKTVIRYYEVETK